MTSAPTSSGLSERGDLDSLISWKDSVISFTVDWTGKVTVEAYKGRYEWTGR